WRHALRRRPLDAGGRTRPFQLPVRLGRGAADAPCRRASRLPRRHRGQLRRAGARAHRRGLGRGIRPAPHLGRPPARALEPDGGCRDRASVRGVPARASRAAAHATRGRLDCLAMQTKGSASTRIWSRDFILAIVINFAPAAVFYLLMTTMALYAIQRSEEHTSELQSRENLVCRLL